MLTEFNVAEFAAKHSILTMELKDAVHRTLGTSEGCATADARSLNYVYQLQGDGLWLFSYAYLVQRGDCLDQIFTLKLADRHLEYCLNGKGCLRCNKYRCFSFNAEFGKEKEKILNRPIGLCLDCVSTGRESFRTNQCRIKHAENEVIPQLRRFKRITA